jgi:hypothetical protein
MTFFLDWNKTENCGRLEHTKSKPPNKNESYIEEQFLFSLFTLNKVFSLSKK